MHASDLDGLSRSDLISKAEALGVDKPAVLTRAELADEIVRRTISDPLERRVARGLLGVARDLVARVVERGLHLSDAAALIRGLRDRPGFVPAKPPIATVTLAEIYATQGHKGRALAVLDQVLDREPDHAAARVLRDRVAAEPIPESPLSPEPDDAPPTDEEAENASSPTVSVGSSPALQPPSDRNGEGGPRSPGPIGMLDDAPLPERYDVNEVVLMPVDPKTVFVYWEVRQSTYDEARAIRDGGRLVLRVLAVCASWEGPSVETRDIEIEQLVGDWFVRDLPVGAVLRAAVGWRAAQSFEPLSVAMDVSSPPATPSTIGANELALFTAGGVTPLEGQLIEDEGIAASVERARRRVADLTGRAAGASSSWSSMVMASPVPSSWTPSAFAP